jgi:hypothetical protein
MGKGSYILAVESMTKTEGEKIDVYLNTFGHCTIMNRLHFSQNEYQQFYRVVHYWVHII